MNQIHEDFKNELKTLLKKFNAEIILEDRLSCSYTADDHIVVEFNTPVDGEDFTKFSEIDLGRYFDSDKED